MHTSRGKARLLIGLFLFFFAFYALTGPGYSISGDGSFLLLSARNLLRAGSTSVPAIPGTELSRRRGVDGRDYPKFAPGLMLAHLPMLALVRHLEPLQPIAAGRAVASLDRDAFFAPFTNAWLMAAAVCGIALCGIALGFPVRASVALAALLAVGSPLWLYARIDSTEALQAASLIGAAYFLVRDRDAVSASSALAAGTLLGLLVGAKLLNVIVVPWFLLFAARAPWRAAIRVLSFLSAPLVVALALLAAFSYARFGSPFDPGYALLAEPFDHPLLDGLWMQLFSLGHGLPVFFPAVVLLLWTGPEFVRRFRRESILVIGVFASCLVVYSKWWAYWGMSWGPRFLVPVLPLLALGLLPLMERGPSAKIALAMTVVGGVGVQGIAVASSYWGQVGPVWQRVAWRQAVNDEARVDLSGPELWDQLVHLPSISPLRVGAWWVENASCRDPGRPAPDLSPPPWSGQFPWLDPARDPAALRELSGLDLWAVPQCWKRSHTSLWSPVSVPIPSNPRLAWLLLGVAATGVVLLAGGWRRVAG